MHCMNKLTHGAATEHGRMRYRCPRIEVIPVSVQNVLCLSDGRSQENDYGDGGFHNLY